MEVLNIVPAYVQKVAQDVKEGKMGDFKSLNDPGIFFGKIQCKECKQVMWHVGWDKARYDLFACAKCENTVSIRYIPY